MQYPSTWKDAAGNLWRLSSSSNQYPVVNPQYPVMPDDYLLDTIRYLHRKYLSVGTVNDFRLLHPTGVDYRPESAFPDRPPRAGYPALLKEAVKRGLDIPPEPPSPLNYRYKIEFMHWSKFLDLNNAGELEESYTHPVEYRTAINIRIPLKAPDTCRVRVIYRPVEYEKPSEFLLDEWCSLPKLLGEYYSPEDFLKNVQTHTARTFEQVGAIHGLR